MNIKAFTDNCFHTVYQRQLYIHGTDVFHDASRECSLVALHPDHRIKSYN